MLVGYVLEHNDRVSTLYHLEDLLKVVTARGHHQLVHRKELALTCHRGIRVCFLREANKIYISEFVKALLLTLS